MLPKIIKQLLSLCSNNEIFRCKLWDIHLFNWIAFLKFFGNNNNNSNNNHNCNNCIQSIFSFSHFKVSTTKVLTYVQLHLCECVSRCCIFYTNWLVVVIVVPLLKFVIFGVHCFLILSMEKQMFYTKNRLVCTITMFSKLSVEFTTSQDENDYSFWKVVKLRK